MSRKPRLYLENIVTACGRIREYTAGLEFDALMRDQMKQDAVVRNLEIIGEAATKLPAEVTAAMPQVRWRDVCGFRDVLAHQYFGVNYTIVWDAITTDLPILHSAATDYLKSISPET